MQLDDENFELYAAHWYDIKKATSYEEFQQDLKKITYLRKLFSRHLDSDDLQLRLILNHLVVLFNCFGAAAVPMLFLKLEDFHPQLKPFLQFLEYLPKTVGYNDVLINTSGIESDQKIIQELRKI